MRKLHVLNSQFLLERLQYNVNQRKVEKIISQEGVALDLSDYFKITKNITESK